MNKKNKTYSLQAFGLSAMLFCASAGAQMSTPTAATPANTAASNAPASTTAAPASDIPRTAAEARYIPGNPTIQLTPAEQALNQVGKPGFNAVPPQNPDKLYSASPFPTQEEKNAEGKPAIPKITAEQAAQLQPQYGAPKAMTPEQQQKIKTQRAQIDKCIKDNEGNRSSAIICIVGVEGVNATNEGIPPPDPKYQSMPVMTPQPKLQ